jgi:hypothetical protein
MADFVFTYGLNKFAVAGLNWSSADSRVLLVSGNTTAAVDDGTGRDAEFIGDIGTLDEFDGANYSRQTLTESVAIVTASNRVELRASNTTFSGIEAGTRTIVAAIVFLFDTNDAASTPVFYIDSMAAFPYTADGNDLIIVWDATGVAQLKTGS